MSSPGTPAPEKPAVQAADVEAAPKPGPEADASYRQRKLIGFGIFAIFFLYYLGSAVVQTPSCKALAETPVAGMPLGLLLSLAIFPVSWALIGLFFWKMR